LRLRLAWQQLAFDEHREPITLRQAIRDRASLDTKVVS
jgi:hypothetical protein